MLNFARRIVTSGIGERTARLAFAAWFVCLLLAGLPWQDFSLDANWESVSWIPFPPEHRQLDDILNFAFYLPFGIFGVTWRWSRWRIAGCAALISFATEMSQLFGRTRYPATTDLITNTAGAIVGALVWASVEACAQRPSREAASRRSDARSNGA